MMVDEQERVDEGVGVTEVDEIIVNDAQPSLFRAVDEGIGFAPLSETTGSICADSCYTQDVVKYMETWRWILEQLSKEVKI